VLIEPYEREIVTQYGDQIEIKGEQASGLSVASGFRQRKASHQDMVDQIHTSEEETLSSTLSGGPPETQFQHELAALHAINWALSQSLDLDRVLELALETTLRVVDSQTGCIHVPGETQANELRLRVHTGLPADLAECIQAIPQDNPEVQRIVALDEVAVSEGCETLLGLSAGDDTETEPSTIGVWVCFPLLARDRFQGLMSVLMEEFTPNQARLLKTIGQHLGTAIDNAQLYRRVQQDAQRLSREAKRWHALNQAAVAVGGACSERDVYNTVTHTLSSLGLSAIILALDSNAQTLTVASLTTPLPRLARALERLTGLPLVGFRLPLDQFEFYRRVVEQGKSEFVKLGAEHFAQLLPESLSHLAPRLVRRASLDYGTAVPLRVNEQNIAILIVAGSDLVPEDVPVITAFADQASAAIENARLIEAERRQREVAEILRDLVVTVNSTLDVDQVLNIAVYRLQALHQATACSVSFLEEDGETFVFRATTDPGIDVSRRITFPASKSVAGQAIRERKVQVVDNVTLSRDYRAEIAERTGVTDRSLLTAPLFAEDQPLGVIQVLSASANFFTQADAELLTTTAALIETAIARAQAYAQAVQLAKSEYHQREVAETLREVALLINASLDLDTVLDRILEQLAHVVDYDSTSLMLVEDDKLSMRASRGFEETNQVLEIVSDVADNTLFQEMAVSRRPILISDVKADARYRHWAGTTPVRSWIGVPLVVRGRVIGQLAVDKHQPNFYDEDDAELVLAFAHEAAIAIENAQLFDSERQQREIAESLQEVATILNASLDLDTVLTRIIEQLRRVVEYDSAGVLLEEGDDLVISGGLGFADPNETIGQRIPLSSDDPAVRVLKNRHPLVVADVQADPTWFHMPGAEHIRGWMGVPLLAGEQPIGVLTVDNVKAGAYSQEDAQVVQSFANQAAIAIQNARLFQAAEEARQLSDSLREIGESLASTLDPDEVMHRTLDGLARVVPYDSASVMLIEDGRFHLRAWRNFPADSAVWKQSFAVGEESLGYEIYLSREPMIIPDVHQEPRWVKLEGTECIRCWLGVPLVVRDRSIGILNLDHHQPSFYTEDHAAIASVFAAHAAIAIENAQLFEAEQRQRQMAEALHQAALALTSTIALDQVFGRILAELQHVVPYDSATVQLLKGDQLEIIGGRGFPNLSELLGVSFPARGNNPNALVLESKEPVIIADVQPHYPAFSEEPHAAARIRGWLGVPLLIGDRIIGMLALDKHQPDFYNETHAQIAMAYAAQAAIAIENARLHQALQDYAAELETRVEARTAEVNREHERLRAVLANAGEAIAIANDEGVIEYANPAWEELTGYNVTQAIQDNTRILDDETFPDLLVAVPNVAQPQRIWRRQMVSQRPDGATYVVDLTVTPVFDDAADLVNLVAIYRDVTKYKELDRIKSEFLSTAAHELRGPLTSILGFTELLLFRGDLSGEEQARFLKYIHDHALHLKQLVSDLLDISRIESGASFAVKLEPIDLCPFFEQEIQSWREANPDHTYQLHADCNWPQVRADRDRVRQVMRNLLSNATKYSPDGGTISVSATSAGGFMEVTVADEGIGMTSEELIHIFEKFWRADASSTAIEGTGLGLVIVKHIVEQHGGHIWIESAKNKGTVVHFTLPMVERQLTVLIAEDEDGVREIEHRILTNNGIATLLSSNGRQALEMAQTHRPDLILLDLMMPGMSGQDVLHALKSNPATQHIPVLVVSARSNWQTIEESYLLGAVDFLTKPFEYQELLGRVRRALKMATSGQQPANSRHLPPASST
jgi:PAS domain S-box-containing protein